MQDKTPLVTIVSGYYNRADFVDESIYSLINQSYENIEIIIFDDCSTDGTHARLIAFEKLDPRVRVIRHETNKGFVKGLKEAISVSKGKYIAIHGSGDFSFPDRIKEQVKVLNDNEKIGVVGCNIESIEFEKKGDGFIQNTNIHKVVFSGNAKEKLLSINLFSHGEVMIRRKYYDMVGGYREVFKFSQDYDLWCRISVVCDFYIIQQVLYKRYILRDGASFVFNKVLIQRLLAEFIRQCHKSRISTEPDLVDKYGMQAFFFFKYTRRFFKGIYPAIIREFTHGVNIEDRRLVRHILSHTPINLYSVLVYLYYFVLPKSLAIAIINSRKRMKA